MKAFRYILYTLLVAVSLYALENILTYALELYQKNELQGNKELVNKLKIQAKSGDTSAAFLLASAYKNGKLGRVNLEKSYYWYKEAARNGDADAMLMLGWLYYKGGENISVDTQKAKYWFTQAASRGVDEAVEMLALLK